jgi:2-amino-4-hydroxy-6-hydroxymethyldihydropteridine diphosphokinase
LSVESHCAWIGIGTNLGNRHANLAAAIAGLASFMSIDAASSIYESPPFGYADQPDFLNMVVRARTRLAPAPLLERLQQLERELGRVPSFRMGPRTIDLDLLLHGDAVLDGPGLTLPHPGIGDRPFVYVPLLELDLDVADPRTGVALRLQTAHTDQGSLRRVGSGAELL